MLNDGLFKTVYPEPVYDADISRYDDAAPVQEPEIPSLSCPLPDPTQTFSALTHMLDYGIGDFGRYRRLISALTLSPDRKEIALLERILRRNAAYCRDYEGFGEVVAALEKLTAWQAQDSGNCIEMLYEKDAFGSAARAQALRYFAQIERRSAARFAVEALEAGDARERAAAAHYLGRLKAMPLAQAQAGRLADALSDPSKAVRTEACDALALFRDRRALPGIRKRLHTAVTPALIECLTDFGERDDYVYIARLHDHETPEIRQAVAEALGDIGDPRYRRLLTKMAKDPDVRVAEAAKEALLDLLDQAA